jgi:hypothetical protein
MPPVLSAAEYSPKSIKEIIMSVRAKFHCGYKSKDGQYVGLSPVYTGSEENKKFFEATPGGEIRLWIGNTEAAKQFEVGKQYYVDFTEAPNE